MKNRGLDDVLMLVCDGLKGLPEAVETVWPRTIVQTCVVHLLRNSFRYAARQDWDEVWGRKYPAIVKLGSDAWAEFVPFLSFDVEIRKVICSTNAIESVNARIRKAVHARGHFPNESAALKCVYTALMSLDPRQGPQEMDHALEGTLERLPDRLRRPTHPGQQLNPKNQDNR